MDEGLRKYGNILYGVLFAIVVCLASVSDFVHSPTLDEVGHLTAGLFYWEAGSGELYEVNPPLVKLAISAPVAMLQPRVQWNQLSLNPGARTEWQVGRDFISLHGARSFQYFSVARLVQIVFVGIWLLSVKQWANDVAGPSAGFVATLLSAFCPMMMGWSATICPDVPAAAICVLSFVTFRTYLLNSTLRNAMIHGIVLGLAFLTKSSLVILPLIYLVLLPVRSWRLVFKTISHSLLVGFVATYVLSAGYGFERCFTPLGEFKFFSATLAGRNDDGSLRRRVPKDSGNRFASTCLAEIPVPVPASYLEGLDLQKYDFELGMWSYLRGEHKFGGWWYWYVYALLVKTPVGTIGLFLIACGSAVWRVEWREVLRRVKRGVRWKRKELSGSSGESAPSSGLTATFSPEAGEKGERGGPVLHENLILLAPAVCLFVLVSSQTGFSRYLRYVLPCYPFVFIWISQIFSEKAGLPAWLRKVCWGLLAWSVISSLSVFPHSMSYFNELAGGPENGPAHLIDASIDWGQDVLFLADWTKEHPEAKPLYLSLHVFFDPRVAGIEYEHPPVDPRYSNQREYLTSDQIGPKPGWYSISVHQLYSRNKEFAYLFDFPKADMVGYSIYIYHLTQQDVDDWNRKHGFE